MSGIAQGHSIAPVELTGDGMSLMGGLGTYDNRHQGSQEALPSRTNGTSYSETGRVNIIQQTSWNGPRAVGADPYSPDIVYDLLQGKNEWKNIQDIVKITFKAVCDTVKVQG